MARQVVGEQCRGLGIDVADIDDFEHLPYDRNSAFYARCFSTREITYCRQQARPAQHFAARFAAKEAAVKAFAGIQRLALWQVEVERAADGSPRLLFWDETRTRPLDGLVRMLCRVSLSHSENTAMAIVAVFDIQDAVL